MSLQHDQGLTQGKSAHEDQSLCYLEAGGMEEMRS